MPRGLVTVALLLWALLSSPPASHAARQPPPLNEEIDATIQRATAGGFWGVALIARGDQIIFAKGYGHADYATTPNTPDTRFEIASLTKQFTAAAIYTLIRDGRLAQHDPLGDHLPALRDPYAQITVHQLLTHTSGLSPDLGLPYASTASADDLIRYMQSQPLASRAGRAFAYSNMGYAILAALIEHITDETFQDYMREAVFDPAALAHAGFIGEPTPPNTRDAWRLPQTRGAPTPGASWHTGWGYKGMGGVMISATELHKWIRALAEHRVIDQRLIERMWTPAPNGSNMASGWIIATTDAGRSVRSHSGSVEGFTAYLAYDPDDETLIILLSNNACPIYELYTSIDALLHPAAKATLTINARGLPLSPHHAASLSITTTIRVSREQQSVRLDFISDDDPPDPINPRVRLLLPAAQAQNLLAQLERINNQPKHNFRARLLDKHNLYLARYLPQRFLSLEGLSVQISPKREGTQLRIHDEANRFIPLISEISPDAAEQLAQDLTEAIAQLVETQNTEQAGSTTTP